MKNTLDIVGRWKIRRYVPKKKKLHQGHSISEILHLQIYKRLDGHEETLAKLKPIPCVKMAKRDQAAVLPIDRAIAWEELIGWVKHLAIFRDRDVEEGQFKNRIEWEKWAHNASDHPPNPEELYDWKKDQTMLERVRPRYQHLAIRLSELIGQPMRSDFAEIYPNIYDDEGLSDKARKAIWDLRVLFGDDLISK